MLCYAWSTKSLLVMRIEYDVDLCESGINEKLLERRGRKIEIMIGVDHFNIVARRNKMEEGEGIRNSDQEGTTWIEAHDLLQFRERSARICKVLQHLGEEDDIETAGQERYIAIRLQEILDRVLHVSRESPIIFETRCTDIDTIQR